MDFNLFIRRLAGFALCLGLMVLSIHMFFALKENHEILARMDEIKESYTFYKDGEEVDPYKYDMTHEVFNIDDDAQVVYLRSYWWN